MPIEMSGARNAFPALNFREPSYRVGASLLAVASKRSAIV